MYKVQVQSTVSKIGQVGGFFRQNDSLGVATETEFVVLLAEGRVKLRRIFFDQQAEVFTAMADMAPAAIVVGDGTVQEFLVFNFFCKGRQSLIVTDVYGFVMTRRTETRRILFQQELDARSVRRMALHTPVDIIHNAMLVRRVFSDFLNVFVAGVADKRREVFNELRVAASVRIVTADAVVLGRLMNKLKFLQFTFCHDMAGKTKLAVFLNQQVFVVGTVRRVTNRTFADGDRSVQKRKAFRRLVARGAEIGDGFGRNQKFVVTAVRIVALGAITRPQGFVNDLLRRLFQMTIFTEILTLAKKLPCMFVGIQRLMARSAFAKTHRSVNVGFCTVVRMTICGHTCFLKRGRFFHRDREGDQRTHQHNCRLVYPV